MTWRALMIGCFGACLALTASSPVMAATAISQTASVEPACTDCWITLSGSGTSYTLVTPPASGTVKIYGSSGFVPWTGTVTGYAYVEYSTAQTSGSDSFTWYATDAGGNSGNATCTINLKANSAPTASSQSVAIIKDTTSNPIYLTYSHSDYYQNCTWKLAAAPAHGTVYTNNNTTAMALNGVSTSSGWNYHPAAGWTGTDTFKWLMSDGIQSSGQATVTLTVKANTAPVVYNRSEIIHKNVAKQFKVCFKDSDPQAFVGATVTAPVHGTVSWSGSYATYTPASGYTGNDSFSYTISDGMVTSAPAICSLVVHDLTGRAGQTVELIVNSDLLPEIQGEIDRMQADMQNEGYTVVVEPWSDQNGQNLWNYLVAEYRTAGRVLAGAILIGQLPSATNRNNTGTYGGTQNNGTTDMCFWNMMTWQDTSEREIWVSRIHSANMCYGDEVDLVKRALQANHDYRTGASRYPKFGYTFHSLDNSNLCDPTSKVNTMKQYVANASWTIPGDGFTFGGTIINETTHGISTCNSGPGVYAYQTSSPISAPGMHSGNPIPQVRFALVNSCEVGIQGNNNPCSQTVLARNTGNIYSTGATNITYVGAFDCDNNLYQADALSRLSGGDTWGSWWVDYPPQEHYIAMFYGDLSTPMDYSFPANATPTLSSFTSDKTTGPLPLTVNFSAAGSDSDGTISYVWYPRGTGFGKLDAAAAGAGLTTQTATYTIPHRFRARVEIADNYLSRAWKEIEIRPSVDPTQPMRINCGRTPPNFINYDPELDYTDSKGNLWLHDQRSDCDVYNPTKPFTTWGTDSGTGQQVYTSHNVAGTNDPLLFQSATVDDDFIYRVPLPDGQYFVRLGFADIYTLAPGTRVFDVSAQGQSWLTGFDIVVAAGGPNKAVFQSKVVSVSGGELVLSFTRNASCTGGTYTQKGPLVSTIEILPYSDAAPVANITPGVTGGEAPFTATFDGSASTAASSVVTYLWDFGDGTLAMDAAVSHQYKQPGTYTVTLTVTDDHGLTNSTTTTVTVTACTSATTLTLQQGLNGYTGAKDAMLDSTKPDNNNGANLGINCSGSFAQSMLFGFDISSIPANSTILSATLELNCSNYLSAVGNQYLNAYRVITPWTEGTKVNATPSNGVTWNQSQPGVNWATPGGDFDPAPAAGIISNNIVKNTWLNFDLTGLVTDWYSGNVPNYGVEVFAPVNAGQVNVPTKENTDPTGRPMLVITYVSGNVNANHAPAAVSQTLGTASNIPLPITLSATDADDNLLSFVLVQQPPRGSLSGTLPNVVYSPDFGFTGTDSFTFKASDGMAFSNVATVTINVASSGTFTLNASAGTGGTISPSGAVPVASGGSQTFTITANSGYVIANVQADGTSLGAVTSHTFSNVTANHTISATFGTAAVTLTTASPLTAGTAGIAYSQNFSATGGVTPYAWSLASGTLPAGLNLSAAGILSGTPTVSGSFNFTVRATDRVGTSATKAIALSLAPASLVITTTSPLPASTRNVPYSLSFSAGSGTAPYAFNLQSGSLPTGLSLSTGGVLSGTPAATGTFNVTVKVTDNTGVSATQAFALTINPAMTLTTASPLPSVVVGQGYSKVLGLTGGTAPYTWSISAGALPEGMTLDNAGTLLGGPPAAGTSNFTVQVTDAVGATTSKAYSLSVLAALTITPAAAPDATLAISYSQTLAATGGVTPYTWTVVSGTLPNGLSLSTTGVLSGTPTATGSFDFTVQVADASGQNDSLPLTLIVDPAGLVISTASPLAAGTAGATYSQTFTATGGTAPYGWSLASGTLPAGLTLSGAGVLSGTATAAGASNFSLSVTDNSGSTATHAFALTINPVTLAIATASPLAAGTAGTTYSQTFTATGGTAPYGWSLASGTLPAGLTLSGAGVLSGTATAAGASNFSLSVTDNSGSTTTHAFALTINARTYTITASAGANGSITPSGALTLSQGDSQNFTIAPHAGYAIADVLVDGVSAGATGSYTLTNVSAGHTIVASFAAINHAPVIATVTPASPATANTGVAVTFSATATDSDGDTLSYAWDFGDGTSAIGASVSHAFATAGAYSAKATVSDGALSDTRTIGITVSDAATLPGDPPAPPTPIDPGGPALPGGLTLNVTGFTAKVSFIKSGTDSVALSGVLSNFVPAALNGKVVTLTIGGETFAFALSSKGKAVSSAGSFALTFRLPRAKKGQPVVVPPMNVTFKVALKRASLASAWVAAGLLSASESGTAPCDIGLAIGNENGFATVEVNSKVKANVSAALKK